MGRGVKKHEDDQEDFDGGAGELAQCAAVPACTDLSGW